MKESRIESLMQSEVQACRPEDDLNRAAKVLWEHDIGSLPVVDQDRVVIGMVTDRDICMAAYTQGKVLAEIPVQTAMCHEVHAVRAEATIDAAHELMRAHQIRRVPVIDEAGKLIGIVSLNDLATAAIRERGARNQAVSTEAVGRTLAAVCEPRQPSSLQPRASA